MRIVHDVDGEMQISAGMSGSRMTLFACDDDESIEIEGDPKYIIPMLEQWLELAKSTLALWNEPKA